ncbi:hypothetical protein [Xenorhabdus santafensis]|nr:hypothetical protein [Xenorhabdus sp. 12]
MSWAEDEGIDAYDEAEIEKYLRQQEIWQIAKPEDFDDLSEIES